MMQRLPIALSAAIDRLCLRIDNRNALAFLFALAIGLVLMSLVPPFQSPDEFAHVNRAYLLGKGQILLDKPSPDLTDSGGLIDDGLLDFTNDYIPLAGYSGHRLTQDERISSDHIRWAGSRSFRPITATGYYFPLAYTPQAFGLVLGESLDLTVAHSYFLARLCAFSASLLIITFAFRIFRPNLFSVFLLMLPMSIFQFIAASLDGVTMALGVLVVSLFMRGVSRDQEFPPWMSYVMGVAILLLTGSRVNLLPLLVLPLVLFIQRRDRRDLWIFLAVSFLALAWTAVAIKTTQMVRFPGQLATGNIILHYLAHPLAFGKVLANTLGDPGLQTFYRHSFIGILGWLDTPLPNWFYSLATGLLAAMAVLSLSVQRIKANWLPSATLAGIALCSMLLTFLALLVGWSPHPATLIDGVQGRYMTIPFILLGYAMSGAASGESVRLKIAAPLLAAYAALLLVLLPRILVERYYMQPDQPPLPERKMAPSQPLAKDAPIVLLPAPEVFKIAAGGPIRLGVRFGTYLAKHEGEAILRLRGKFGDIVATQRFRLSDLADNQYHFFDLGSQRNYESGEITSLSGTGISTWEIQSYQGKSYTCLVVEHANGRRRITPGCPLN